MSPLGHDTINKPPEPEVADGTVVIYGASDDCVQVDGNVDGCDEYSGADVTLMLVGNTQQVRIRVRFDERGVWTITAGQAADGMDVLPVQIAGGQSTYSVRATIDGVRLVIREHT